MKHSVFKDLAPAYIDKLTSEETNEQIEKHMNQCEECRNYLNKMKGDLFSEDENERRKDKRNIDYFKKVRSKNRKKILVIVSSLNLIKRYFILIKVNNIFWDIQLTFCYDTKYNLVGQPNKKER